MPLALFLEHPPLRPGTAISLVPGSVFSGPGSLPRISSLCHLLLSAFMNLGCVFTEVKFWYDTVHFLSVHVYISLFTKVEYYGPSALS